MELLTGKWRRKNRYERLDGGLKRRKKMEVIRLRGDHNNNGGSPAPRRVWKMRAVRKLKVLKIACSSPMNLLRKMKNAYVDAMLSLAGNVGYLNNESIFGNKRIPKARRVLHNTAYSNEEFDARMAYEIYKALIAMQ